MTPSLGSAEPPRPIAGFPSLTARGNTLPKKENDMEKKDIELRMAARDVAEVLQIMAAAIERCENLTEEIPIYVAAIRGCAHSLIIAEEV